MNPRPAALCVLTLLVACSRVERPIEATLPADGLDTLRVTIDRGDLAYEGTSEDRFVLEGTSAGFGSSESQAAAREAGNEVTLVASGDAAVLEATSESRRGWVDLELAGPSTLDLDVWVKRGSLDVSGVTGQHVLTADRITARGLAGDADLLATSGGMDVELWPFDDGELLLESSAGEVVLRLPWGLPYDIEVLGDPAYEMYIEDLGFHSTFSDVGYFTGTVGDGSIRVAVSVHGGSFQLLEAF